MSKPKDITGQLFGSAGSVDVLTGLGSGGGGDRRRDGGGDRYRPPRRGGGDYVSRRFGVQEGGMDRGGGREGGWHRGSGGGGGGWSRGGGGGERRDRDDYRSGGGGGGGWSRGGGGGDRPRGGWERGGGGGGRAGGGGFSRGGRFDDRGDRFDDRGEGRGFGGRGASGDVRARDGGNPGAYVPPSRRGEGGIRYGRDSRGESVFSERRSGGGGGGVGLDAGNWNQVPIRKHKSPAAQRKEREERAAEEKRKREEEERRKNRDLADSLAQTVLVDEEKSKFLQHLEEESAVEDAKDLQEGLQDLPLEEEEEKLALARVVSKSLGAESVNLGQVLEYFRESLEEDTAAEVLLQVLRIWREGRSMQALRDLIDASTGNDAVLEVLYPKLDEHLVAFLEEHDLVFLRSVGNIGQEVLQVFQTHKEDDEKAVQAAQDLIKEKVDETVPLGHLLKDVGEILAQRVFPSTDRMELGPVLTFAPLLQRLVQDETLEVQAELLFVLQGAWYKMKRHKDVKKLFQTLSQHDSEEDGIQAAKVLEDGAYYVWKEDLEDETPGKSQLLIKVFSYIDTLTPPFGMDDGEDESEDEGDDDDHEEGEEEEEDLSQIAIVL